MANRVSRTKRVKRVFRTVEEQAAAIQQAANGVPIPAGIEFNSDEELLIWKQFTSARREEDWRDIDLVLLARIVNFEHRIRVNQALVDEEGEVVETSRGNIKENPRSLLVGRLLNRQAAMLRSLCLMTGMSEHNFSGTDMNNAGQDAADRAKAAAQPARTRRAATDLLVGVSGDERD